MRGGLRDPRPGEDVFLPGSTDPADREVVVLSGAHAYALRVSGADGRPLPLGALERALTGLAAAPDRGAPVDGGPTVDGRAPVTGAMPFAGPGYLDADTAYRFLAGLMTRPGNAATYARLGEALFVVTLVPEAAGTAEHLEQATYAVGRAWPFKPLSLQVGLEDEFTGIHLEHSMLDGATVGAIIARAQDELTRDGADAASPAEASSGAATTPEPVAWELTPAEESELGAALTTYDEQARHLRFRIVPTRFGPVPELPFRFSHDAGCQLVMAYAQLRAYGKLRSTYESVDMREYEAGRTECLRPNTPAMAACGRAMVAGTATPEHLAAALAGHRDQVKRCKAGQGIDRHLLGLDLMARGLGLPNPLTAEAGYRLLTTDFLSTTSLGDQATIVRAAFHLTSPGGIGVYYVPLPEQETYEFSLNWDERDRADIGRFEDALHEGTAALATLLTRCA